MDELQELHNRSLEWGCICNLIDRISAIEDRIEGHWDELLDMIADIIDQEGQEGAPEKVFFDIYGFIFHLYCRIRTNPNKRPFNQVNKIEIVGKEVYRITNYDYKTFKWAKAISGDGISNDFIDLPADKLTTNQQRQLDRRIGE